MKASLALLLLAAVTDLAKPDAGTAAPAPTTLQYTTYFYTAGEAIIHGYEPETKVRVVSLDRKGTIWEGVVNAGDTRLVKTGPGVFGFIADKKATILVGTPSSCTVVGYYLKDQTGSFKSNHFYAQLPTGAGEAQHFVVFAYEPSTVQLFQKGEAKPFKTAELAGGSFLDVTGTTLSKVAGSTIEVVATGKGVTAEVYYDEGFMVPADNGRGSGKRFMTYVGTLTEGVNDLNIMAQGLAAKVKVRDLKSNKTLFEGGIDKGQLQTLTLSNVFVEVTSDVPVNVVVAAFKHYTAGYAEHHFQTGLEGSGIENDFLVTTSGDLWLFSYFTNNAITVEDARTHAPVFSGTIQAGQVRGLKPGFGLFRVKGSKGLSVMGGASSCGADYSPAGSMFTVDEALFQVIAQVREERARTAAAEGRVAAEPELSAPLTTEEWKRKASTIAPAAPARGLSLDEVNERAAQIKAKP